MASMVSRGGGSSFVKTTLPFIRGLGSRLAAWVDHHDHDRHADYAGDPRFVLSTKAEHGACPEMVTPEVVHKFLVEELQLYIAAHPGEVRETAAVPGLPQKPQPVAVRVLTPQQWVEERVAESEQLLYGKTCNGLTHGGEIEALAVLAYRPDLVHLDRIDYSSDHSHGHKMDKLRRTRSYQPVLTDIRSIAPTGWFGSPQHATAEKGHRMLTDIADAIAKEATDIFAQLDAVQGGTAEVKRLRQVK